MSDPCPGLSPRAGFAGEAHWIQSFVEASTPSRREARLRRGHRGTASAGAALWVGLTLIILLLIGALFLLFPTEFPWIRRPYGETKGGEVLLIRDVRIFVGDGRIIEQGTVLVRGGLVAGVPAVEVLQAATWKAAHLLGAEGRFGLIEPGYEANLLLVEGNPLADIRALDRVTLVVYRGKRVVRADLLARGPGFPTRPARP